MSPVMRICSTPGCGQLFEPRPRVSRCPQHQAEFAKVDNARRHAKQWRQGRNSKRWQQLRAAALRRDRRCLECGSTDDLTVHLDPALEGNHDAATLDDLATLCRRCHGRVDGARATAAARTK